MAMELQLSLEEFRAAFPDPDLDRLEPWARSFAWTWTDRRLGWGRDPCDASRGEHHSDTSGAPSLRSGPRFTAFTEGLLEFAEWI